MKKVRILRSFKWGDKTLEGGKKYSVKDEEATAMEKEGRVKIIPSTSAGKKTSKKDKE